jgi:hypothetical protein
MPSTGTTPPFAEARELRELTRRASGPFWRGRFTPALAAIAASSANASSYCSADFQPLSHTPGRRPELALAAIAASSANASLGRSADFQPPPTPHA